MIDVRTYRAATMQEAMALVRRELGAEAIILHTRESGRGLLRFWRRQRRIEVTAGVGMHVRSRRAPAAAPQRVEAQAAGRASPSSDPHLQHQLHALGGMMEEIVRRSRYQNVAQLPDQFLSIYAELIESEVPEDLARELVTQLHDDWRGGRTAGAAQLRSRLAEMMAEELVVHGPIVLAGGQRKVVALVGPTGVGKTTTIAKLAAQFRLRQRQRVGLVTVDTYRVAAVEHLRAYAEIIDLPMRVVMSPSEMRRALQELQDTDLVLIDTAGRSPREELKIQELKSLLHEAAADEIHLVLNAGGSVRSLISTAEKFASVGVGALLLTKLDEAAGFGSVLALARSLRLPLSYVTTGQNVPDDVEVADRGRLARLILGLEALRG